VEINLEVSKKIWSYDIFRIIKNNEDILNEEETSCSMYVYVYIYIYIYNKN